MLKRLIKPRFIMGFSALIIVSVMMGSGVVESDVGVAIIVGILMSFGAYYAESPKEK